MKYRCPECKQTLPSHRTTCGRGKRERDRLAAAAEADARYRRQVAPKPTHIIE